MREDDYEYYKIQASYWQRGASMYNYHYLMRMQAYYEWPTEQRKQDCIIASDKRRVASGTAMDYLEWAMRSKS